MDLFIIFFIIGILSMFGYGFWKVTCDIAALEARMNGLDEHIKRNLDDLFENAIKLKIIADTTKISHDRTIMRVDALESNMSAVDKAMEYMKFLRQSMDSLDTQVQKKVDVLEQTAAGVAKASTEIFTMYEPLSNRINMLSARLDGIHQVLKGTANGKRKKG